MTAHSTSRRESEQAQADAGPPGPGGSGDPNGSASETDGAHGRAPADPLQALLAERETLYRELQDTWGTTIERVFAEQSIDSVLSTARPITKSQRIAPPTATAPPEGVSRQPAARERSAETEISALRARLQSAEDTAATLNRGCEDRDRRIAELEAELAQARDRLPSVTALAASPPGEPADQERIVNQNERTELLVRLQEEAAQNERLRDLCARQDEMIAVLQSELRQASAECQSPEHANAVAQVAELEARCQALMAAREKERRAHAEETARLTKQMSTMRQRYEAQLAELTENQDRRVDWPGERSPQFQGAAAGEMRSESPGVASASNRVSKETPERTGPDELFVLDESDIGDDTAQRLIKFGYAAAKLGSSEDPIAHWAAHRVVCLAVNLALPSAWRAARGLRSLHPERDVPIYGYALARRSDSGFWFGRVDFAVAPFGTGEVAELVKKLVPGAKQVIAIGPDEGLLARARANLINARIGVNVALDRRHALDMVRNVYPQAAVVYPGPHPVDAFRAVAGVRSLPIFRDLPSIYLLDEASAAREEDRLSAGARTTLRLGNLKAEALADLLAEVLNNIKAGPTPKSRASR